MKQRWKDLQGRRGALRLWTFTWMVLVWCLLWGTFSPANVLSGLVLAAAFAWFLPLPPVPTEGRLHLLSLIRLILYVAGSLLKASVQVAWLAIRPQTPPLAPVLRARLALKSDLVLALAVNILNLVPGSIVLEIDQARRLIYVHLLDGSEKAVQRFYHQVATTERMLIAAFERDSEWQPDPQLEAP